LSEPIAIPRENYARADEPGVVIVFELDSVEQAKRYVADFPTLKACYLDWFYIRYKHRCGLRA
jgi:hypothetical protein